MTSNTAPARSRIQKTADGYARFLARWAWVLPFVIGALGLASAITTQVFLPLWGAVSVFAALGILTVVLFGKVRIPAGSIAATVLTPFIGQVGIMSFTLLLLSAVAYSALFVIYGLVAAAAKLSQSKARPVTVASS